MQFFCFSHFFKEHEIQIAVEDLLRKKHLVRSKYKEPFTQGLIHCGEPQEGSSLSLDHSVPAWFELTRYSPLAEAVE